MNLKESENVEHQVLLLTNNVVKLQERAIA